MKKLKSIFLLFIIFAYTITFAGCWNYREIEQLGVVTGVAIDKHDDKYIISIEMLKSSIRQKQSEIESLYYSGEGLTIFDAIRKLITKTGKKLFWSHCLAIIFSEEIAKEGIIPDIDWFIRDSEPRRTAWVLISKDIDAGDILKLSSQNVNRIVSMDINDLMKNYNVSFRFPKVNLRTFRNQIESTGVDAVAPLIMYKNSHDNGDICIEGSAVFKKDKLVGMLNGDETFRYLIISEKVNEGLLITPITGTNTKVALEIFNIRKKINCINNAGNFKVKGNFKITAAIDEIMGTTDVIKPPGLNKLIQETENNLKKQLEDNVRNIQKQYDSDIFGFGNTIEIQNPKLWKATGETSVNIFNKIVFEANVQIEIKGSGRSSKNMK
jgi:germination protein, Ger(x)C family